jgi:hypothetical protein
LDNIQLHLD